MTQAGNLLRTAFAPAFPMFSGPITYERNGVPITDALPAAVRDFRGIDLFGSAEVGDRLAIIPFEAFAAMAIGPPQRYDRVVMIDGHFSVADWRYHPPIGTPVWVKLAIRGGSK